MKRRIIPALMLAAIVAAGLASTIARADSSIPVADFYKKPQFGGMPILSPDGKNMAVLTPRNGRFVLAIINLDVRTPKVIASDQDWDIVNPYWVNNKRLVFSISKGADKTLEEQKGGGLFAVNIDGSDFRKLAMTVKEYMGGNAKYDGVTVLQRVGGDSNELFVSNNERGRGADFGASDVFTLDTTNGRRTLLTFDNPGKVSDWELDHANVIRVAVSTDLEPESKRMRQTVYYRDADKQPWRVIYKAFRDEGTDMTPLGFDFDNKTLFVAGRFNGRDKSAVHVWNFADNSAGEIVADHDKADIEDGLIFDKDRKKVVGVFFEGMKQEKYYFDEEYARIQATLDASLAGQEVNFSWRGDRVVVSAKPNDGVAKVYFYDIKKKSLEQVFSFKPEFDGKKLGVKQAISYKARDGLEIPAYLTLPPGAAPKALPLIAYIHGGPHSRDHSGSDPNTLMFASRGYAVLQPQFRMSTGFGWKHHTAGWKQWGLAMQDDITDGIEELVKQGIVDRNRVCIIGASYGGYATVYGLVKNPDLYKCGINWVGVTDVEMLFSVTYSDMNPKVMANLGVKMHGDPKDTAYMRKASALENADKIKAPLLMGYGSDDDRVPLVHGEKLRDKLLKQGNSVEWIVMAGEGHNWAKESNRIMWGERMLSFVDRYIGPNAGKK